MEDILLSHAWALLTVTPAILGWVRSVQARRLKSIVYYLEAVALIAGLVILAYFAFMASGSANRPALLYSLVPFLAPPTIISWGKMGAFWGGSAQKRLRHSDG